MEPFYSNACLLLRFKKHKEYKRKKSPYVHYTETSRSQSWQNWMQIHWGPMCQGRITMVYASRHTRQIIWSLNTQSFVFERHHLNVKTLCTAGELTVFSVTPPYPIGLSYIIWSRRCFALLSHIHIFIISTFPIVLHQRKTQRKKENKTAHV